MAEREASDALDEALSGWLKASGHSSDGDLVVGWVLLTEQVNQAQPDATSVSITTSDGMTHVRQLGILDCAQVIARNAVLDAPDK